MKDRSDNRERDRGGSLAWLTLGACLLTLAFVVPEWRGLLVVAILVTAAFRFGVPSSRGGEGMEEKDTPEKSVPREAAPEHAGKGVLPAPVYFSVSLLKLHPNIVPV